MATASRQSSRAGCGPASDGRGWSAWSLTGSAHLKLAPGARERFRSKAGEGHRSRAAHPAALALFEERPAPADALQSAVARVAGHACARGGSLEEGKYRCVTAASRDDSQVAAKIHILSAPACAACASSGHSARFGSMARLRAGPPARASALPIVCFVAGRALPGVYRRVSLVTRTRVRSPSSSAHAAHALAVPCEATAPLFTPLPR